jgi:hypothetical protein
MAADRNDNSCFAKSFQGPGRMGSRLVEAAEALSAQILTRFRERSETIEIIRCF